MKILIISTSDIQGGAAIAAYRLMEALNVNGAETRMMVCRKKTTDNRVVPVGTKWRDKWNFYFERFCIFRKNGFSRKYLFDVSIANTGHSIVNTPEFKEADIIHLHWINQGMLSLDEIGNILKSGKKVVWTMHDMWPITGICHHAWSCTKFEKECGSCVFLNSKQMNDISKLLLDKKKTMVENNAVHFVSVSSWLKRMALKSAITKESTISVIPNIIDINVFCKSDKKEARNYFSLPLEKKIIVMGAHIISNPIKGFNYLKNAMDIVAEKEKNVMLVLFGEIKDPSIIESQNFPIKNIGYISDNAEIAKLYAAADVNVVPSLYETFGQTITESMSCGCPSVSFNNSGQTDIIDHKVNGYLANYKDVDDLAQGILWILFESDYNTLSINAREKVVTNYAQSVVAKQYLSVYSTND